MTNKLWGGRFSKKTNKLVEDFTGSIHFDQKLAKHDCLGSLAHIDVLKKAGLLTSTEHGKLKLGLKKILGSIDNGSFFKNISSSFEDIHSYIQNLLEKDKGVGKVALKLQTCRSRNDQVVVATKLYCMDNIVNTNALISLTNAALLELAKKNQKVILPGFTHLQHAIPIALKDYLSAYKQMLDADQKKLIGILNNIKITMGSGAIAGTFIEASKYDVSITLNGKKIPITATSNSIFSVSDRDFVIEILGALSILSMHLSRLAEDFILWSTKEFDFIDIDEAFCTGSSLMPQKKNPDVLELMRGYSGKLYGNLVSVLVTMKGLPLSYNRDMQLDKEPLFESFEIVQKELEIFPELLENIKFKTDNIEKQLEDETLYATDLSDYLVKNKVPFKEAHAIIGELIQHKLKNEEEIRLMDDQTLKKFHPLLTNKIVNILINPEYSVKAKKSIRRIKAHA